MKSYSAIRILGLGCCLLATALIATGQQKRPAITGISHMCVYVSDATAADNFYGRILGATKGADPQNASGTRYYFSATQFVEVLPLPAQHDISRMACWRICVLKA